MFDVMTEREEKVSNFAFWGVVILVAVIFVGRIGYKLGSAMEGESSVSQTQSQIAKRAFVTDANLQLKTLSRGDLIFAQGEYALVEWIASDSEPLIIHRPGEGRIRWVVGFRPIPNDFRIVRKGDPGHCEALAAWAQQ